jgi:hypothetical protein
MPGRAARAKGPAMGRGPQPPGHQLERLWQDRDSAMARRPDAKESSRFQYDGGKGRAGHARGTLPPVTLP